MWENTRQVEVLILTLTDFSSDHENDLWLLVKLFVQQNVFNNFNFFIRLSLTLCSQIKILSGCS